jgi:hypothetical protein
LGRGAGLLQQKYPRCAEESGLRIVDCGLLIADCGIGWGGTYATHPWGVEESRLPIAKKLLLIANPGRISTPRRGCVRLCGIGKRMWFHAEPQRRREKAGGRQTFATHYSQDLPASWAMVCSMAELAVRALDPLVGKELPLAVDPLDAAGAVDKAF